MGLSIAISSGTAKSLGLFVMDGLHVSEFWMPAFIGAFAFPLLSLLGWAMTRLPHPTKADMELRTERVALDRKGRSAVFKSFMPVLLMLFFANLFITVLQDLKEDFLVKIIDVKAAGFIFLGFCPNRRYGHFGDSRTVRGHVDGEEQRQRFSAFCWPWLLAAVPC